MGDRATDRAVTDRAVTDRAVTYRAVRCEEFGPVSSLQIVEQPSPELRPGTVRIEVAAAGVNYVDGLMIQGAYQIKPPLPFVPGMEVVGTVVEVAPPVAEAGRAPDASAPPPSLPEVGDRVLANVGFGGYASEAVAPIRQVVRVPATLSAGQAATFMQSYMTGWFALVERARVVPGQSILVLGAGSGVGLAAVDLASALGMRVIAAASSEEKRRLAMHKGALATVDSLLGPVAVKDAAREFAESDPATAGRGGVDAVYDPVGGELGETCLRALGEDGQFLVIGFVAGIPQLAANQVLLRNRRVTGVDWGAWAGRHPAENAAMLEAILEMIAGGQLQPVEPSTYPLADAAQALTDLAERRVAGKVVLVP